MGSVCLKERVNPNGEPIESSDIPSEEVSIFPEQEEKISLSHFILLRNLGRGTFGKVMLVQHRETFQLYAMKVLVKSQVKSFNQKKHVLAERKILEINEHPLILKLHYAFQTATKLYLIVDYMPGGELFYHLKMKGRMQQKKIKFYAAEVLVAMDYLHKKNIIYRDLKPENILLDDEGHIKLCDFGLSKICSLNDQYARSMCGTPEYIAPEVVSGDVYTKCCDWWTYGALLFDMFTGKPPFYSKDKNEMIKNKQTQEVPIPEDLSPDAQDLLRQLLVIDPQNRLGNERDAQEIYEHPFFQGIEFDKIENKQVEPPVDMRSSKPFQYFDQNLVRRTSVNDTPVNDLIRYQVFSGFSYNEDYNKLLIIH